MMKDKEKKDKERKEHLKSLSRKASPERKILTKTKQRKDSFGRGR